MYHLPPYANIICPLLLHANVYSPNSLCAQEIRDKLHVPTSLFDKWSVARLLECDPFDIWNSIEVRLNGEVLRKVVSAVDQKRWDLNEVQTIDYTPGACQYAAGRM